MRPTVYFQLPNARLGTFSTFPMKLSGKWPPCDELQEKAPSPVPFPAKEHGEKHRHDWFCWFRARTPSRNALPGRFVQTGLHLLAALVLVTGLSNCTGAENADEEQRLVGL